MSQQKRSRPYFTVIIPCLNEEKYVPNLLKNLNSQSFKDFETIVIDGNSDDLTQDVVRNYKSNYPLQLLTTTTRSPSFQRNLGASKAKGSVLIFFDADTQIPKNYLKKIHDTFESKKPHFLTTYIDVNSDNPSEKFFEALNNIVFEVGKIAKTPLALGAMQAVKKGAFEDVGGYDEKTKFGEDGQLFQKLYNYNYKYLVLTRPRYIFSMRRIRKDGVLESINQYLKINLKVFTNGYHTDVDYKMGGSHYEDQSLSQNKYTQALEPLMKKLTKFSQKRTSRLKNLLDSFLPPDRY